MQIDRLECDNFRLFKKLELPLGRRLTLLVGENGAGKTSVLDALSIGLGQFFTSLPKVTGNAIKQTDLRQHNNKAESYTRIKLMSSDPSMMWDRTLKRDQSAKTVGQIPPAIGLAPLKKYVDSQIINPFNEGIDFVLPVFSYYGVSRALLDVPLRRRGFPKSHSRFEALENALMATSRFKRTFVWFYNKEFEEQRKQQELKSFDYKLPELEAVRKAITTIFPEISEPHIMLNPLRFAVKMNGEVLDIMQLSDGYKTLLSLVIDLASRMAQANPESRNPLETPSIVLIDEIDLHLHPQWQKRVIGDLLRVFPNTQFVLTTHSPYIIESVNNYLMRHHIRNFRMEDTEVVNTLPLDPAHVEAYFISGSEALNLMDQDIKLLDDKLIHPFNAIAGLYDRMRDIQWENRAND